MPSRERRLQLGRCDATDFRKPEHIGEPQPDEPDVALLDRTEHELDLFVHRSSLARRRRGTHRLVPAYAIRREMRTPDQVMLPAHLQAATASSECAASVVFSGSSGGRTRRTARPLGALAVEIVTRGLRLVYGGASVGLMGV